MTKEYFGKSSANALMGIVKKEMHDSNKELKDAIEQNKTLTDNALDKALKVTDKGAAGGVAPLDEDGKVSSEYLPGYVDDVIEMSSVAAEGEEAKWYVVDPDTGVTETEVDFVKGKIYLDVDNNKSYRWGGTALVDITSPDMVELEADEIQKMWDAITIPTDPTEGEEGQV